jgi:hypothetical protein
MSELYKITEALIFILPWQYNQNIFVFHLVYWKEYSENYKAHTYIRRVLMPSIFMIKLLKLISILCIYDVMINYINKMCVLNCTCT